MRPNYLAAIALCAIFTGACDSGKSSLSDELTIDELMDAPNGREIKISHILKGKVIVFSSEYLPHNSLWSGNGDAPLIHAAWECSGGITITEYAGEYLQVIAPSPGTLFGADSNVINMAQCVSDRANERFSVSVHDNALGLSSLIGGEEIMPPTILKK